MNVSPFLVLSLLALSLTAPQESAPHMRGSVEPGEAWLDFDGGGFSRRGRGQEMLWRAPVGDWRVAGADEGSRREESTAALTRLGPSRWASTASQAPARGG